MNARLFLKNLKDPMGPETLSIRIYCLMAALAFGLAVVVVMGGATRFSSPNFLTARSLVGWTGIPPVWIWSSMFFAMGTFMIISIGKHIAVHVLRFGLVVYLFLSITFMFSAAQSPVVSLTGAVVYLVIGVIHLILAVHLDGYGWSGRGWE